MDGGSDGTSESQGVGRASKGRRELLGWRCQWGEKVRGLGQGSCRQQGVEFNLAA